MVAKTAAEASAYAQRIVPVDTGRLKQSIGVWPGDGGLSATVTPDTEYMVYVEYGTRYMAAQPYMMPTASQYAPVFKDRMEALLHDK